MNGHSRQAIERDIDDLRLLSDKIVERSNHLSVENAFLAALSVSGTDYRDQERQLEAAAWGLRRTWLELAHRPGDTTPKSPCYGQTSHIAGGGDVDFGYERDLDVSVLERRSIGYLQQPPGWSTDLVLLRSGQAALSGLLQLAVSQWGHGGSLSVLHSGGYFETTALLKASPQRVLRKLSPQDGEAADLIVVEPVWCDGRFGFGTRSTAARRAVIVDTTLLGPAYDLSPYLGGGCDLVFAYSSGLKLDQAGLELANVGIVRIFAREGNAQHFAAALKEIRALTATGLTLDEMSALSAPWFMDRRYADTYDAAIFDHNRCLAASIGNGSPIFEDGCHPSLISAEANAPFCSLKLRHSSGIEDYRALVSVVLKKIEERRLLVNRGGSFGFRGHRFDLIEPKEGDPFLRVALGWRDGHSRQGLCDLFAEIAKAPSINALQ